MAQIERRICEDDGILYTKKEFLDYFGEGWGMQKWITASVATPTTPPSAPGPQVQEKRINSGDGVAYTKQEFLDYFGLEDGCRRWEQSPKAPRSSSAVDSGRSSPSSASTCPPVAGKRLSAEARGRGSIARGSVGLTTARPPVTLEKAKFGVAVNPAVPKDMHASKAFLSPEMQKRLRKYWVLVALIVLALLGFLLAIILFSLPCDPILTPFEQVTYVNRTNFTAAPFDGMILIDESGSIADVNECGQNCKFSDEVDLSIIVARTLYDGVTAKAFKNGVEDVHFTIGSLTWNTRVSDSKKFYPMPDIDSATQLIGKFKENVGRGATRFAPPLATCANFVTTWEEISEDPGAFKMCMLLSDGVNNDGPQCEEQECTALCGTYAIPIGQCNVENIAWLIKSTMNISIPAAYLAIKEEDRDTNANNMYCYSSCNMDYKSIDACKAQLFGSGNLTAHAETRARCRFFIDGEFDENGRNIELERKLVELANSITSEVTFQSSQSSAALVETGLKEEGCNDPGYFWLLLFFLPLIVYLFYFPCKRRRDLLKERIRNRLMAQREAMHEDRVARMEKAQAIRERLEANQAEQAAKQLKIEEAEKAVAAATGAANAAALEKAQKEALQKDAALKKRAADEKVAEKELEIEELKPKVEPKPKSKSMPKPPEAGEKKKFKWDITAADQYIWAGGSGAAAPKNVAWGRMGKPSDQAKGNGAMLHPSYLFGRKSGAAARKSRAARKSGAVEGDPYLEEEEQDDYLKRLSMAIKQEANERAEQQAAMDELEALEEEIKAAVAAAAMTSEAAEKALLELEALKKEEEQEDAKYDQDFMKDLQLERDGKLEEDGEFWLRCCACCCRVQLEDDDTYLGSIERGRGHDVERPEEKQGSINQQKEQFINKA